MERAKEDYLTGLWNRQGLYEWYEGLSGEGTLQFMFMDLDNFKSVNDTYGHNVGDDLLKAIAKILKRYQKDAVCARLGGDEFVLVVYKECPRKIIEKIAADIIERIQKKEGFSYIAVDVSASIGILLEESSKESLNDILFKIDTAMYQAKAKGKSCYVVFNDIADEVYDGVQMEQRQKEALRKNEFEICYYPVISAQTSKLFISEVCLIWNQPDGRRRYPWEFMPVFEKNGFIRKLDIWTLKEICKHLKRYHEETGLAGRIAVPVSRQFLFDRGTAAKLLELLAQSGAEPSELVLEVGEDAFSRGGGEILQRIKSLKEAGFGIGIIEVGVDFSSLRYWDKMDIDYIRLSPEYLSGVLRTKKGRQVVKTLLAMGHDLKIQVVADGVSSKEDMLFLSGCGCNAISGSYYSDSLSLDEYREFVKGKIVSGEQKVGFAFLGNLLSEDGELEGKVRGGGVEFVPGIAKRFGGVKLPGGSAGKNVIELPSAVLASDSYTIGMWLKPARFHSWTSAVYARFFGGFMSYVPDAGGGNSIFRVSEDADVRGFHDVLGRQLQKEKWFFICLTFDGAAGALRYYINGRKIGYLTDVPMLPSCKQVLLGGDPFQDSFEGILSGVVFYDNVKAEEEIKEMYEAFLKEEGFAGEEEAFWMGMEEFAAEAAEVV